MAVARSAVPVYYINMRTSEKRNVHIRSLLSRHFKHVHRVEAVTKAVAKSGRSLANTLGEEQSLRILRRESASAHLDLVSRRSWVIHMDCLGHRPRHCASDPMFRPPLRVPEVRFYSVLRHHLRHPLPDLPQDRLAVMLHAGP